MPRFLIRLFAGTLIAGAASAQTLAHFDPIGPQASGLPVVATQAAPGLVVGDLSQSGFLGLWGNTNVWPVGQLGVASPVLDPNQYVTFDVTPSVTVDYASLSYSRFSYLNEGNRAAAVRTSLDNFTADVDTVTGLAPVGAVQIDFDLSSLPATAAPVTFRIYFYDAPSTGLDWVDLVSTSAGGTGLTLTGSTTTPIGTAYCAAIPNSTGTPAVITGSGSSMVHLNNVRLTSSSLPLNSFGFFLTSLLQGNTFPVAGSQGRLCLGGAIGRFVGPGQIKNSGSTGTFSLAINLLSLPQPTGAVVVQPGNTWNFTTWYRDSAGGSATSNFSNGLAVLFTATQTVSGMVPIPAGTFMMGSNAAGGAPYFGPVGPVHQVTISTPFWMGRHEVTQAEYQALMGSNPSFFPGSTRPVELVTWHDARAYCAALTAQQASLGNLPLGYEYRLPTEAEWEYACRAGTTTEFHYGPDLFCNQARIGFNHHTNSPCFNTSTGGVGSHAPNAFGLYDMHGNVLEWCLDSYDAYGSAAVTNPFVTGGSLRVFRGGSWLLDSNYSRSAERSLDVPGRMVYDLGFRVVLAPVLVP